MTDLSRASIAQAAARYRTLRTYKKGLTLRFKGAIYSHMPRLEPEFPEALDAALDKALAAQGAPAFADTDERDAARYGFYRMIPDSLVIRCQTCEYIMAATLFAEPYAAALDEAMDAIAASAPQP